MHSFHASRCGVALHAGYGREEQFDAGGHRVYDDPRDLLEHLDEVGLARPPRLGISPN